MRAARVVVCALFLLLTGYMTVHGQTARTISDMVPDSAPRDLSAFDTEHWSLGSDAEIVQFAGRRALTGTAFMKDIELLNGILEVDLWTTGERNFAGLMFRVQSFDEFEWVWLRTHKTNGDIQDGIQYAPVYKGVACWQLVGGPGGMAPVNVPKNEWVHLKLEIENDVAKLYVKDMAVPVMVMDHLHRGLKRGSVGLRADAKKGVYFSNFSYHIDRAGHPIPSRPATDSSNLLTRWRLSPPYPIDGVAAVSPYPEARLSDESRWITPEVDSSGLINITRYNGRSPAAADGAILRTYIDADRDRLVKMNFGYSDAITIFLNRRPLFWGNSAYRSRNMAYGGWISYNDAVFMELKKGRNELLLVVAEDFGGWGFQAKLDDIDGIEINSEPEKVAR